MRTTMSKTPVYHRKNVDEQPYMIKAQEATSLGSCRQFSLQDLKKVFSASYILSLLHRLKLFTSIHFFAVNLIEITDDVTASKSA